MERTHRYLTVPVLGIAAIIVSLLFANPSYASVVNTDKANGIMNVIPQHSASEQCLITGCPPVLSCTLDVSISARPATPSFQYFITQADTLTMSVHLTANIPPIPTGTMTFYLEDATNPPFSMISAVAQPLKNGVVVYSVKGLPIGSLAYSIQYTGDTNYNGECLTGGRANISFFVTVSGDPTTVHVVPTATPSTAKPNPTSIPQPGSVSTSQPSPTKTTAVATPTDTGTATSISTVSATPIATVAQPTSGKQSSSNGLGMLLIGFLALLGVGGSIAGLVVWRIRAK